MKNKKLSEVLTVREIIEKKNNRILIISGVGSGKNFFVEKVLKDYGNILYISSRRAKVDEILTNKECKPYADWDRFIEDITVLTNKQVEFVVKNQKFDKPYSDIIEHYDFIVVDEAHSIFTDATYTDVFHLYSFIEYVAEKYPHKKVILMTATPEPIPAEYMKKFEIIDKTQECINICPKRIELIEYKEAIKIIRKMKKGEKTIYYGNFASRLVKGKKSLFKELIKKDIYKEDEIAFCMSADSVRKYENDVFNLKDKVNSLRSYICENNKLPDETRVLLTTSTLKEGINIEYEDDSIIKMAFCESHLLSEIQQFAGRMRDGLEVLYVIDGVEQHYITDDRMKYEYLEFHCSKKELLDSINKYYDDYIKKWKSDVYNEVGFSEKNIFFHNAFWKEEYSLYMLGSDASKYFIDYVEKRNRYIRYNHMKNHFELYVNRFEEQCRVNKKLKDNTWNEEITTYCKENNIGYIPIEDKKIEIAAALSEYLLLYEGREILGNERDIIKNELREKLYLAEKAEIRTINKALLKNGIHYKLISKSKTIDGKSTRYLIIEKTNSDFKLLDAQKLKLYIHLNDKVTYILEKLGHQSIKFNANKNYYSCTNVDGDNPTAINIFNTQWLNVRNWTRPKEFKENSDIISLVQYDRKCDFKDAIKYLHIILGISHIDNMNLDFSKINNKYNNEIDKTAKDELVPIDEKILKNYEPILHIEWYHSGVMPWTRKKFDIRYSYEESRIIIPIRKWDDGRLVALNKRTTVDNYELLNIQKYQLSKGYHKSLNIYGFWENREEIEKCGYCVIYEGEKSVLLRDSLNDHTGLAIHGKSLSEKQVEIILSLNIDEVIIALDEDVDLGETRHMAEKFYHKKKVSYMHNGLGLLSKKQSPADLNDENYKKLFDSRILYNEEEHKKYLEEINKK